MALMANRLRLAFAFICIGAALLFGYYLYWQMWRICMLVFVRSAPDWLADPPFWQFLCVLFVAPSVVYWVWRKRR